MMTAGINTQMANQLKRRDESTGITIGGMEITLRWRRSGNWDILADGKVVEGGFFTRHAAMDAIRDYQQNEIEQAECKAGWSAAS